MVTARIINLIKLLSGYFISRITRRVIHWGRPISLSIEPTNYCNLHCPECPSGMNRLSRERGYIDFELFARIIDQFSPSGFYLNLYFQGEPFLHPELARMVRYAKSKNIFVASSTNGHFLSPGNVESTLSSGLDRLIISLDGTDAEAYSQYRSGGDFDTVIRGIKELVRSKKAAALSKPCIILQFLVLKSNQHQVKDIFRLGKELGVDKVVLKTAQFNDFRQGNPLMPDDPQYSRYKKINPAGDVQPRYAIRKRLPNHCFRMWSSCVVTWDGSLVPCCFDKDAFFRMGDLTGQDFIKLWKSEQYRAFREKILTSRKSVEICVNCTE